MRSRFPLGKISAFGKLVTGKTPPSKIEDAFGGDIPFITPRDMDGRRLLETTERYLSQSGVCAVKNSLIPEYSVVVSCIGSDMGKVGVTTRPSVTNQQINAVIVDKEKYLPEYLYYALLPRKGELRASAGGTTMPILNKSNFGEFEIPIPSFDDQLLIVNTVRPLDEKIELNTQMNQTLEKIAQRIFKSWFIDFDPVKANAEGVPFDGLSPDIQSLFPSQFVESEMGLIPKGWGVKSLDEVGEFLNGLACQKYPPRDENDALPVIKIAEMKNGYTQKTNKASKSVDSKYLIQDGDFLFSWSGSLTTCYWALGEAVLNQHLFKVSPLENFSQHFVASWVNHHLPEFIRIAADKATTMGHIKREHLSQAKVAIPTSDVLEAFDNATQPLIDRLKQNQTQSEKLKKIRDRLLPKLLSGSIEIKEELDEAS